MKKSNSTFRISQKPEELRPKCSLIQEEVNSLMEKREEMKKHSESRERYHKAEEDERINLVYNKYVEYEDLIGETAKLRDDLANVLNSSKEAVRVAVEGHPDVKFALRNKEPSEAVVWLEDKIFDTIKRQNISADRLKQEWAKLDEIQRMIHRMEKLENPESNPADIELSLKARKIKCDIQGAIMRKECLLMLNRKYKEIKYILVQENARFVPAVAAEQKRYDEEVHEKNYLNDKHDSLKMLASKAAKNLIIREEEYANASYIRKKKLAETRKLTSQILEKRNQELVQKTRRPDSESSDDEELYEVTIRMKDGTRMPGDEFLNIVRSKILEYEEKVNLVVNTMRIKDMKDAVPRFQNVLKMEERLIAEEGFKERLVSLLEKQRNQLELIKCHFRFTGEKTNAEFLRRREQLEELAVKNRGEIEKALEHGKRLHELTFQARTGVDFLLKKLSIKSEKKNIRSMLETLHLELRKRVKEVKGLRKILKGKSSIHKINVRKYLKPPRIPRRLIRVATPPLSEHSEDEGELTARIEEKDEGVLTSKEIKAAAKRTINYALVKRARKFHQRFHH